MIRLYRPREIFKRDVVLKKIGKAASLEGLRARALETIREAYGDGKQVIARRFRLRPRADVAIRETAWLADSIIEVLYEAALPHFAKHPPLAIVAVGGYGRSELFPYSDIDLLILRGSKAKIGKNAPEKKLAEWLLYSLWDLGLAVGHSVRTIEETLAQAKSDVTIRTNLLDARFLCGDRALFDRFAHRFHDFIGKESVLDFVETKLTERKTRHQRCGDSRYLLEPNLKEGKGGLRDLHTLYWLVKYIYGVQEPEEMVALGLINEQELKSFLMARNFLWLTRMHLHLRAGRAHEQLTFDMQSAVAEAMGYHDDGDTRAIERFMKQYFLVARTVGNLTRSICAALEENKMRKPRLGMVDRQHAEAALGPFHLEGERLAIAGEDAFKKQPLLLISLFAFAHEQGLDIHPRTLQLVSRNLWLIDGALRRNPEANAAFLAILMSERNPEPTLRRMSEASVLGRFIPDFGRVIGQMQFDMYHVYTVDEHTIFAIGILHGILTGKFREEMPLASEIIRLVKSRRVLFLALFAHDIAKGRGGDHSRLGEMVVRKLARRFGFDAHEVETCAWLVCHHLLMSSTAFKRDLGDTRTTELFVAKVQTPERLRLLLVLTAADIRAVGPAIWNRWKGSLLRELYYLAEAKMGGSLPGARSNEQANLRRELAGLLPGWKPENIDEYLTLGAQSFFDAPTHARLARLLRQSRETGQLLALDTQSDTIRAITEILLVTPDQHGLFSRISGAMALAGANIVSAKIFTLTNGMAVEMFHIQDIENHAFDKPDKLARLAVYLNKAIANEIDIARELAATRLTYPTRMDAFKAPARVFIENKISTHHSVIEVEGRDRVGFLYRVTQVLAGLSLTIATAHISTYGERAIDVFYVKDAFGMKILHESRLKQIQDALMQALSSRAETNMRQAG